MEESAHGGSSGEDSDDPDFQLLASALAADEEVEEECSGLVSEGEDGVEVLASSREGARRPAGGEHTWVPQVCDTGQQEDTADLSPQEAHRQNLYKALQANRRLQSRLRQVLESLDSAVLANAEQQAALQSSSHVKGSQQVMPRIGRYRGMHDVVDYGENRGRVSTRSIGPSRFFVVDRQVPEANADSARLAEAYRFLPHTFPARDWTEGEQANLNAALLNLVQELRFQRVFDELQARQAAGETLVVPALEAANAAVAALTISSAGVEAEIRAFGDEEWERVARLRLPGRSGAECRAQWATRLRPGINLGPWTKEEDKKLLELAERYKRTDWLRIAEELGTGRAAVDCLTRFQRALNPELLRRPWTHEEEARLSAAVEKHGRQWAAVAAEVGGRTAQQVKHHFVYAQNTNLRKGPWMQEEDSALLKAVAVHGPGKWALIAPAVPHRSDQQCRERWLNVLNPALRLGPWEPEEDAALRRAVPACTRPDGKIGWTAVSRLVPGRTDAVCNRRWTTLQRWDAHGGPCVRTPKKRAPKPPKARAARKAPRAKARAGKAGLKSPTDDAAEAPGAPDADGPSAYASPGGGTGGADLPASQAGDPPAGPAPEQGSGGAAPGAAGGGGGAAADAAGGPSVERSPSGS